MRVEGKGMASNDFKSSLDGLTINDLRKKIDYSVSSERERKQSVEKMLNENSFLELYFDEYYNSNINTEDTLFSESNVSKYIEELGTFLLNSDEEKQRRKEEEDSVQYKFYSNPLEFQTKVNKEKNISEFNTTEGTNSDNVIDFLLNTKSNAKKMKKQVIEGKDLKREDELGNILNDYDNFLKVITGKLKKLKEDTENGIDNEDKGKRFLLTSAKSSVKKDMVDTKDIILGVFGYNITSSNSGGEYRFEDNELNSTEVFREILRLSSKKDKTRLDSDLYHIFLDVENVIEKAKQQNKLSKNEVIILNDVKAGLRDCDIARDNNWSSAYVNQQLRRTVKKLVKIF